MASTWSQHITIDLIFLILSRSIFHPYIAWLIPLCLRAATYPPSHTHVVWSTYYALLVSAVALLQAVDQRFAYGKARKVDWDEEVVVITGGTTGLGRIIVEMYGLRGVSVAVLDINTPTEQEIDDNQALDPENVRWYRCDVSNERQVQKCAAQIEKDVSIASTLKESLLSSSCLLSMTADGHVKLGRPSILINNAGIMHGLPLLSLSSQQVASTIAVNLQSHFNTLRIFLPSILASPSGGTIVTVSSVLGYLGAAHLSDYTASKAALLALHSSLVAELTSTYREQGGSNVRTVLVTPGQLATRLFAGLETPSAFLGPVVEPITLAREIVRMVDTGISGQISLPSYARFIGFMSILPPGLQSLVRWMSGIDKAMAGMRRKKTS